MVEIRQKKLVDDIQKVQKLDEKIKNAFLNTDRSAFVPNGFGAMATRLDALPLHSEQWISSPVTVAKMTIALQAVNADSVLEVGCGSGYQAAILSKLFRRVFTVERIEKLLIEARENFKKQNISNIHTKLDDGSNGWREYACFDRILLSASAKEIPSALFEQLSDDGGVLVAPIEKNGKQIVTRFVKRCSRVVKEELEECLFVPIQNGILKRGAA